MTSLLLYIVPFWIELFFCIYSIMLNQKFQRLMDSVWRARMYLGVIECFVLSCVFIKGQSTFCSTPCSGHNASQILHAHVRAKGEVSNTEFFMTWILKAPKRAKKQTFQLKWEGLLCSPGVWHTDRGTVQKVIVLPRDDLQTEELVLEEVEVFKVSLSQTPSPSIQFSAAGFLPFVFPKYNLNFNKCHKTLRQIMITEMYLL